MDCPNHTALLQRPTRDKARPVSRRSNRWGAGRWQLAGLALKDYLLLGECLCLHLYKILNWYIILIPIFIYKRGNESIKTTVFYLHFFSIMQHTFNKNLQDYGDISVDQVDLDPDWKKSWKAVFCICLIGPSGRAWACLHPQWPSCV
jgi:hypothetical protein